MEKIITKSGIGNDKEDSLIYHVSEKAIINENKRITNLIQKFKAFCERQQENRLGWAVSTLAVQVFFLVPLTLITIALNGNQFTLWIPVIITSFAVALCNLMTLPTKIVLPVFFTSVLISGGVIILSFIK